MEAKQKWEMTMTPQSFFKQKRIFVAVFLLVFMLVSYLAGKKIEFDFLLIFEKFNQALNRFVSLYLPPVFKNMGELLSGIWDTFILSIASSIVGSAFAYLAALVISTKTTSNKILSYLIRFITTLVRNIPTSIWAIILLLSFWFGEFLAFLVMAIGTFGFNARVFADVFDEANAHSIEALNAVGATRLQIIAQSVFPESWPSVVSWTLYAIETNMRDSVVIGMLAGGGIGHIIDMHRNFRRFSELTAAVILVVILVLLFDRLSVYIRERL